METTRATAGMGLGVGARKSPRVRTAVASGVIAVTIASSFALGRFSAPAAVIHGAPAVGTLPAQSHRVAPAAISSVYGNNVPPSPLRPHQPHHRVKFGG